MSVPLYRESIQASWKVSSGPWTILSDVMLLPSCLPSSTLTGSDHGPFASSSAEADGRRAMGRPDSSNSVTRSDEMIKGVFEVMCQHPTLKVLAWESVRPISIFTGHDHIVQEDDGNRKYHHEDHCPDEEQH